MWVNFVFQNYIFYSVFGRVSASILVSICFDCVPGGFSLPRSSLFEADFEDDKGDTAHALTHFGRKLR